MLDTFWTLALLSNALSFAGLGYLNWRTAK